jgi:endonuclease III
MTLWLPLLLERCAVMKSALASLQVIADEGDDVGPDNLDDVVTLPGVGRSTANVILGNAFGSLKSDIARGQACVLLVV